MDSEYSGRGAGIDIEVKAICEGDPDDIVDRYIIFCEVFNERTKQHGMKQKTLVTVLMSCKRKLALLCTVEICIDAQIRFL